MRYQYLIFVLGALLLLCDFVLTQEVTPSLPSEILADQTFSPTPILTDVSSSNTASSSTATSEINHLIVEAPIGHATAAPVTAAPESIPETPIEQPAVESSPSESPILLNSEASITTATPETSTPTINLSTPNPTSTTDNSTLISIPTSTTAPTILPISAPESTEPPTQSSTSAPILAPTQSSTPDPSTTPPSPETPIPTETRIPTTTPIPTPTAIPTCGSRVRRSWGSTSAEDKQIYLDAISAAMKSGYHALFNEVHSEAMSGNVSHRTCGMLYWHRRFLLAYENMLRSLDPRFACVTIPYWDFFADYAKRQNGLCTTFQGCASILSDLGGSSGAPSSTVTINGVPVSGTCVSNGSLSNFCQSSTMWGDQCAKCLPRDNWLAKAFPSGFGYASLARILTISPGFSFFSQNIHYGIHNSIHNTAGSTMATLLCASDPLFFSHHATIDLVHQLFYDCQVGRTMTEQEKKTSVFAYQTCAMTSSDVSPTSTSNISQRWEALGQGKVEVEMHPLLREFFAPLPRAYWNYVSIHDLGTNSYTYEQDALFSMLVVNGISCPKNKGRRKLTESSFTFSKDIRTQAVVRSFSLFENMFDESLAEVKSWGRALEQVELMECLYHDEDLGGVDDLSYAFKKNFRLPSETHTRCYNLLQQLRLGHKNIHISNWREHFNDQLGL